MAMNEPAAFDPGAVERLCRLGGEKFAAQMIDLFSSFGAQKLAEAQAARQAGNLAALAEVIHALKSTAGNVGALRLQDLAARLEQAAREQNAGQADTLAGELEPAFDEARALLELEKAKLKKPAS